ncbi:DUF397 domain-containing protein [Actinomadura sp. NBRC 104412]|uniref:DUF397 domain-containing protein n=1 Tax=Actinomadura sp. NBRC 104412 TaxID=3032203 RepID=UPI002552CF77|nr:DUF397 domain-containing protein [Actinomadura sp. NBRC 104412]
MGSLPGLRPQPLPRRLGITPCVCTTRAGASHAHSEPNGACVEVGYAADRTIRVRDIKQHGQGPILEFTRIEWASFLQDVRGTQVP